MSTPAERLMHKIRAKLEASCNAVSTDDEEEDDVHCVTCAGSGEGQYDGTRCPVCKGRGVVQKPSEDY